MPYSIDNNNIGADALLTFSVDPTANKDFTETDLAANLTACQIVGNNIVGMGTDATKLFGKVIAVSTELQPGTAIPARCTVQARGVARFKYVAVTPVINQMVELNGAGAVRLAAADVDIAAGGHLTRGMVINVIAGSTEVDVWLG